MAIKVFYTYDFGFLPKYAATRNFGKVFKKSVDKEYFEFLLDTKKIQDDIIFAKIEDEEMVLGNGILLNTDRLQYYMFTSSCNIFIGYELPANIIVNAQIECIVSRDNSDAQKIILDCIKTNCFSLANKGNKMITSMLNNMLGMNGYSSPDEVNFMGSIEDDLLESSSTDSDETDLKSWEEV
jgi:hypothetical protein